MNLEEIDIVKRVMEIFSVYGVRSLSMDNIAQHVPVSKKNLLKIAKNKEELVRHIFDYSVVKFQEMRQQLQQNMVAENVIDEILQQTSMMHAMSNEFNPHLDFEFGKYYPEIYAEYSKMRDENVTKNLCDNIERGKTQGVYKHNLNTEKIAQEILADFKKMKPKFENAATGRGQMVDYEQMNMRFLSAMMEKLTNEKGKEYFERKKPPNPLKGA